MSRPAPRLPHICCPHCGNRAFARAAGKTAPTYREVYYHCRDAIACGHVFVVGMQVLRTIRPSARPNPEIGLPIAPYGVPANDPTPPPANDDQPEPLPPAASAGTIKPG